MHSYFRISTKHYMRSSNIRPSNQNGGLANNNQFTDSITNVKQHILVLHCPPTIVIISDKHITNGNRTRPVHTDVMEIGIEIKPRY